MFKVRSFHGLASFYRNFIRGFSRICSPLTETMRGDKKDFRWTSGAVKIFNVLKEKITEQSILALSVFNKVFQVDYDESGSAIGVVLSQEGKPIAYFSEKLHDAKNKYSIYDQQFYAIMQDLKKVETLFVGSGIFFIY